MITRLNKLAFLNRFPRIKGTVAETLWIENIGIWSVDLRLFVRSSPFDPNMSSELQFRFAGEEIIERLVKDKELSFDSKEAMFYRDSLRKGDKLLVATVADRAIFHGLIAIKYKRVYSQYFSLLNHECFGRSFFTHPHFRGKNVCPLAMQYAFTRLLAEGYFIVYLDVATHNEPSLRAIQKIGALHTGSCYLRIRTLGHDWIVPRGTLRERFASKPPILCS
jgi:RimJ/RimL family protein N-acetyltransferase